MTKYPNRLYALRKTTGLSQQQVGDLTGFTSSAVNRHERGNRSLDGLAIERYANLYRVSAYELFVSADEVGPDLQEICDEPVEIPYSAETTVPVLA